MGKLMKVKFDLKDNGAKAVKMSNSVDNYVNVSSTDSVESCSDASVRASWSSSSSAAEGTPISFSMCFFPSLQPPDDNSLKLPAWATQYFQVNMPFRHGILPRDFLVFNLFEDLSMEVQICCPCGGEVLDFPSRGCHSHYFHCRDVGFEISPRRSNGPSFLLHADGSSSFAALQFTSSNPHFTRCMNVEDMSRPLILQRFPNRVADFLSQDRMKYVLFVGGRTWDFIFINSEHGGLFCEGGGKIL
ncbi:auxin response factor 11-like protein [Corchorus olitorius]|uniref:Auxin response factor 11-like protein n=1 Tax=Corchorus olitorius TaxID=93759 RepID=A0A1R3GHS2_9ROSI|nr:auxin response factor 11-like protein [Corchorus olitorius]